LHLNVFDLYIVTGRKFRLGSVNLEYLQSYNSSVGLAALVSYFLFNSIKMKKLRHVNFWLHPSGIAEKVFI